MPVKPVSEAFTAVEMVWRAEVISARTSARIGTSDLGFEASEP